MRIPIVALLNTTIAIAALTRVVTADAVALPATTRPATSQPAAAALRDVNVRFMLRGYCHARSSAKDDRAAGGFGESDNAARPIPEHVRVAEGQVQLIAEADAVVPFRTDHRGLTLRLANASGQRVWFNASDSRLPIVQEAKDADGVWKPIEYLPSSWCGNSYHRVCLEPGQAWTFPAPRYTGQIATKLRFRLARDQQPPLLSNEFDGSVNPEQFTIKQGHRPTDIMDPYLE